MSRTRRQALGALLVAVGAACQHAPPPVTRAAPSAGPAARPDAPPPTDAGAPVGDGTDGEPLASTAVYEVYSAHEAELVACIPPAAGSDEESHDVRIVIAGATGRVTSVQVDGERSGAFFTCIDRVMRSLVFPTATAPTDASFSIHR